ncbi:MAG: Pyrophosphate--fructose 6-phosphate 1-phosphotransferase [Anaerolineales bacterium]|nr:Pyrophosphate--fructose 6-phosphate 1-phosphotransferase [Anaerolineales bacterium]
MPEKNSIRRIAISTGGGDAPGLNAVIRAIVLSGTHRGWEVLGIRDGFNGLLLPEHYAGGGLITLTRESVRGITPLGGTILGTTNRNNPMRFPVTRPDGTILEVNRIAELAEAIRIQGIDAVISVGGDGSLEIADALQKTGIPMVVVPKTIDNDLDKTEITFGFETAVDFAAQALDRLHSTAASHGRVMVVEVMGRYAGWIALHTGISGTANVILIPEIPYDINKVSQKIKQRMARGVRETIVVVAEGARPIGGEFSVISKEVGQAERLGGVGEKVAAEIEARTGRETRVVVLGHLLRGGSPIASDRLIALRFGAAAVRALEAGESGVMVVLDEPNIRHVPFSDVVGRMKRVPLDSDVVQTARDLGISFGD